MAQFTAKEHKLLQGFAGMGWENAFDGAGLATGVDYNVDALVRAVLRKEFAGMGWEQAIDGVALGTDVDYDVDALVRAVLRIANGRPTRGDVDLLVNLGVFDEEEDIDGVSWVAGWVMVDEKLQLGIPLDADDCAQLLAFSEVSAEDDAAHAAIHKKLTRCARQP